MSDEPDAPPKRQEDPADHDDLELLDEEPDDEGDAESAEAFRLHQGGRVDET
jgi:hypothetical protein